MGGQDKTKRVLDIYIRLCEGKAVNKAEAAQHFSVDERSIMRDIDDIRAFLAYKKAADTSDGCDVVYRSERKGYVLEGGKNKWMSNGEILAVSKILLESKAFTKKEIGEILDKMVSGCVPRKNMQLVTELISNEKFHYVEIQHKSYIEDKLWKIGSEIGQYNLLKIDYQKQSMDEGSVERVIQPLAILFSEYYFYLIADIVELDEKDEYVRKYDYPAVFRIDRILKYRRIGRKFKVRYSNRFEEGELRKRVQFMYMGELVRLQFRYTGNSIASILDRLPTARVVEEDSKGWVVEAEVYGKGVLMWLLTQGSKVEVLRPKKMREEMKTILAEMLGKYE